MRRIAIVSLVASWVALACGSDQGDASRSGNDDPKPPVAAKPGAG